LDQIVVPPAAADRAQVLVDIKQLENSACIVSEASHDRRIQAEEPLEAHLNEAITTGKQVLEGARCISASKTLQLRPVANARHIHDLLRKLGTDREFDENAPDQLAGIRRADLDLVQGHQRSLQELQRNTPLLEQLSYDSTVRHPDADVFLCQSELALY